MTLKAKYNFYEIEEIKNDFVHKNFMNINIFIELTEQSL